MSSRTCVRSRTAISILIGLVLLGAIAASAYAMIRLPETKAPINKSSAGVHLEKYRFIPDSPVPSATVPVLLNRSNRTLDVQVIVDTGIYTYGGTSAQGDIDMTDADIETTMLLADRLFAEKTGVHIRIRGIERSSLADVGYGALWGWARNYVETVTNPPEAFVIFSLREPSWMNGGFAQLSEATSPMSGYCNEFVLDQGLLPISQRISQDQRNAGIAIIDWSHKFASCGYGDQFPRRTRVSETPTRGECRNNPDDVCLIRNADYFQCASLADERSAKPLFFRASSIVHELMHTLDAQEYGHIGEVTCNAAMAGDTTYVPTDTHYNEEWFSMCPRAFSGVSTRIRSCP